MSNKLSFFLCSIMFLFASCNNVNNAKVPTTNESEKGESNMKIWAHRGCCYAWPENTLQAFEAATALNITGIELDIQLTKDNEIVVIHDETVNRTTNGNGNVQDFTLQEIKKLKIQTHPGLLGIKRYTEIPTIKEVFDLLKPYCLKNGLKINIELKNSRVRYEGMEDMILALVADYELGDYIVYSSFNPDSILMIKEKNPSAQIGILNSSLEECFKFSKENTVDALHPYVKNLGDIKSIRAECTLPIRAYGLESKFYPNKDAYETHNLKDLEDMGVTDVFTNVPEFYAK